MLFNPVISLLKIFTREKNQKGTQSKATYSTVMDCNMGL